MKLNKKGIDLIHSFEGLELKAYLCLGKVWTIGYGNTFYEDGRGVKDGDEITKERAEELFGLVVKTFISRVKGLLKVTLNENQFSALVSFAYNLGVGNLRTSTLLKKVNINPADPSIYLQFMRWNKAGGKVLAGLTRRRKAEADLYATQ